MMQKEKIKAQPFDCMQFFYGKVQEPRIRCLIRFQDHISETALKGAAGLLINAIPLIGCVFNENLHCWEKRVFTADDIVSMVNVSEVDEGAALKYLLTGIDHTREPQVKMLLVREKTNDTLCVIINHMISDGGGFKEFLYLFSALYSKCENDAGYDGKTEIFGERSLSQLLRNLRFKGKLNILFSKSGSQKADPAMIMPIRGGSANPMIVMTCIEKEQFDVIHSFAKNRHASVNDVLLTAYIRALHRVTGCNKITVPCPVDLRKYRKADQRCGICNLTGNYICSVEIPPDATFDDTLRKVSIQMQNQKSSSVCLKGPMLFHMMFHVLPFNTMRKLFYKISPVPVTSYTNLGILDDAKLSFGNHMIDNAFISTAVKKAPYFQLSVSTCQKRCTLTSSLYGTEEDRKFISDFLSWIKNELVV